MQHVEALVAILRSQGHACTFKGLSVAVSRPRPAEFLPPSTKRRSVNNRSCFFHPIRLRNINSVRIAVPNQFHSRERMVPTEVHAADARPVCWEIEVVDCEGFFRDREDPARTEGWNPFRS